MRASHILAAAALVAAAATAKAAPDGISSLTPPFRLKPPEMTIPAGAKPGSLRRILQPFEDWLLICDENLTARKRVCNATQTLTDRDGGMTFSWSLAATMSGRPAFIIRVPRSIAGDGYVVLSFSAKDNPIPVSLASCDKNVCIGFLPVTADVQERIDERSIVAIEIGANSPGVKLQAPLAGLSLAVKSIR